MPLQPLIMKTTQSAGLVDFKSLFESAPGLYLILLPDLTIVAASQAYLDATMTKMDDIIDHKLFDIFPDNPDDTTATGVSNLRFSLEFVLKNHAPHTMAVQKYDIKRPDGSFEERFWSPFNKPVINDKGEIIYIIHRVEDVTDFMRAKKEESKLTHELKEKTKETEVEIFKRAQEIQEMNKKLHHEIESRTRTEEELRKSKEHSLLLENELKNINESLEEKVKIKTAELTGIFERITEGFIALDKNFCYTYINKKAGEMIDRIPATLTGKYIWDEFPDAIGSSTYHAITNAMNEQQYKHNIDYYPPLDLWQENHVYPSPDGLSIFIRDITEQMRANEKIEKEKNFSNSLINSLPGILYLFDSTGKMMRWNKNFESVSEYNTEEISKMHPIDFFDVDEKEYIVSRIQEVFVKGVSDAEANFFTKSGKKVPFYFTGTLIMLDEGPCLIGMGIDVSEKVNAENDLKNSYDQLRALASHLQDIREEERTSIAREIHDELGQQLTGLKMDIAWLSRKIGKDDDDITQKINSTLQLTDETVRTVRRIATELRPSILDDLGLIAAMEWHSTEFEKRFSIETTFFTELNSLDLETDVVTALFRIYQESLTNVLRHADATKVSSSLVLKDNRLMLQITDNGKGFDINSIEDKKTLGILGMKERTLIIGGEYEIKSSPGNGTSITVSIPFNHDK